MKIKPVQNVLAALAVGGMLLAVSATGGCRRSHSGTVNAVGSTSIQPFAEMLAQEFNSVNHKGLHVEPSGGGSSAGLQAVKEDMAGIGMCSRELSPEELPLYDQYKIALDGLAIVVNPDNPISHISLEQARQIFSGEKTNWMDFGGHDAIIRVITREEGSGTREAFVKKVMENHKTKKAQRIQRSAVTQESNGAVIALVKGNPDAIGYISLGLVDKDMKALSIDIGNESIPAQRSMVSAGKYPLSRPFLFVTRKGVPLSQGAKEYIDFVLSPRGQAILEKEGLVAVPK